MSKDHVKTKLPASNIPNREVFEEFIETNVRFRIYRYVKHNKKWVQRFKEAAILTKQEAEQIIKEHCCPDADYAVTKEVLVTMRPGEPHDKEEAES